MTPEDKQLAIELAWRNARLNYKFNTRPVLHKIDEKWVQSKLKNRVFVLNCSRRLGKTTWGFIKAAETALASPNCSVAFVADTSKNLDIYIQRIANEVLKDCPLSLKPEYLTGKGIFRFTNDSIVMAAGSSKDSFNNLRGNKFKLAIIDEAAHIDHLESLIQDVLMPALLDSDGYLIICSTPPLSPEGYYLELCEQAKVDDSYAHYEIYAANYPPYIVAEFEKAAGGKDSSTWKREYLAQMVIDENLAVFPNFKKSSIVPPFAPESIATYHGKYIGMDI